MTIGDVAKSVGISVQAVRFYEKRGLIKPGGRTASGYRIYDDEAIGLLKFIKNARIFGFSLNETAALVRLLKSSHENSCSDAKALIRERLRKYQEEMAQLNSRYTELSSVVESCPAKKGCGKGMGHDKGACKMLHKLYKGG